MIHESNAAIAAAQFAYEHWLTTLQSFAFCSWTAQQLDFDFKTGITGKLLKVLWDLVIIKKW